MAQGDLQGRTLRNTRFAVSVIASVGPGVKIDAAVESMWLVVEAHGKLPRSRWGPDPASWLEGASFLKIPR